MNHEYMKFGPSILMIVAADKKLFNNEKKVITLLRQKIAT